MALTFEEQRTNAERIADAALRERVLRGIDVLVREYGEDWPDYVDPVILDLNDCARCVLGQIESQQHPPETRYYSAALQRIDGAVEDSPEEYGFNVSDPGAGLDGDAYGRALAEEYAALTEAWRTVLVG